MLSAQDNEILCRVGPGTVMGELMRQYWIPVLMTTELLENEGPPQRTKLLGENLIAFRDTSGHAAIFTNACPHRGASMFFGRNEEDGLRCVYHGWKFDHTGACVDMPSEPAESNFRNKVRIRSYPTNERNGIIWVYMGPRSEPPPLPDLEGNMAANSDQGIRKWVRESNYMQALEGDIDTIHAGFLHYGHVPVDRLVPGSCYYYTLKEKVARFVVEDHEVGATYGAYRTAEEDTDYWRIAHFLFPFYTMNPSDLLGQHVTVFAWVPLDDEHCMSWMISAPHDRDPFGTGVGGLVRGTQQLRGPRGSEDVMKPIPPKNAGFLPESTDWIGRFRPAANVTNDWLIDREAQAAMSTYTGVPADAQDPMAQESMGPIYDRTQEHLGSTDSMIIRSRQRLIRAAKALQEQGTVPPGVDQPEMYRLRSGGAILPKWAANIGLEALHDVMRGQSLEAKLPVAVKQTV